MTAYNIKNLKYKNILNIKELLIPKGKISIISGSSGLGKSTLLYLLTGKDFNYEGEIYLENTLIKHIDIKNIFQNITSLDQHYILLADTIGNEFKTICKHLNLEFNQKKVAELLQICNLDYPIDKKTENLSGGEKQRLCIARTLYPNKQIILLDEPTSALDQKSTKIIMDNLHNYSKQTNKTIIIISHNDNIISNLSFNQISLGDYNAR